MAKLLIDEGLPGVAIATAFRALGLDVVAVGESGFEAPPRGGEDEVNCVWCAERKAILVTNDLGKKDKAIHRALRRYGVSAVFVGRQLRAAPTPRFAYALLRAEDALRDLASRSTPMSHVLEANGKLRPRA